MARSANRANGALRALFRTSRGRMGNPFSGAGSAGALGGMGQMAAAGGVAGTVSRMDKLEQSRASLLLALGDVSAAEAQRQMALLTEAQRKGVQYMVQGVNVLAGVSMTEISDAQGALLKAGFSLSDVLNGDVVPAFMAVKRVAGDEASVEDIGKMLAKTKAISAEMGITNMQAAASVVSMASDTEFAVDEVARALPRVSGMLRIAGQDLDDFGTIIRVSADKFGSATLAANAASQMMAFAMRPASKKVNREIDDRLKIDYFADGKFKGWEFVRASLLKIAETDGLEAAQIYATTRFGDRGKLIALDLMQTSEQELAEARKKAEANSTNAINNTLYARSKTMGAAGERFAASWDKVADALLKAGVNQVILDFIDKLSSGMVWLAGVIERHPDLIRNMVKWTLYLVSALLGLKIIFTVGRWLWFLIRPMIRFYRLIGGWRNILGGLRVAFGWLGRGLAIIGRGFGLVGRILFGFWGIIRWLLVGLATLVAGILGIPVWVAGAIIAAIAALAAAIWYYWEDIKAFAVWAWDGIVAAASAAWDGIKGAAAAAWEAIKSAAWNAVQAMFGWLSSIGSALKGAWDTLTGYAAAAGKQAANFAATPGGGAAVMAFGGPIGYLAARGAGGFQDNRNITVNGATPRQVQTAAQQATTGRGARQRQGSRVRR